MRRPRRSRGGRRRRPLERRRGLLLGGRGPLRGGRVGGQAAATTSAAPALRPSVSSRRRPRPCWAAPSSCAEVSGEVRGSWSVPSWPPPRRTSTGSLNVLGPVPESRLRTGCHRGPRRVNIGHTRRERRSGAGQAGPQLALEELPVGVAWECFLHEPDLRRDLVLPGGRRGRPGARPRSGLAPSRSTTAAATVLAEALVGDPEDRRLGHRVVAVRSPSRPRCSTRFSPPRFTMSLARSTMKT